MPHAAPRPDPDPLAGLRASQRAAMEQWRGLQARTLDLFGYGVHECAYDVVACGPRWRLRRYRGEATGAPLLMVPAPIKRAYIWDLAPAVSAVRFCLDRQLDVHLLEWLPPPDGHDGIEAHAQAILTAGAAMAAETAGGAPVVIGHSLGGPLAAIACALEPTFARGLVLLAAPLSFEPGSSPFRDIVVAQPDRVSQDDTVPGAQFAQSCAMLSPGTFLWSRWADGALSLADPAALGLHMRIERWALDEMPLPGRLVHEIVEWLYRENRFARGTLVIGERTLGPRSLGIPLLAVVNPADEIGPRAAIEPFFARMAGNTGIIENPVEIGVGLQHLAILAGRQAHAQTWPRIADWIAARA